MNKAITDGLQLTPPPFADGLTVWSSEDGTPGSATYDGDGTVAVANLFTAQPDEVANEMQRLRSMVRELITEALEEAEGN